MNLAQVDIGQKFGSPFGQGSGAGTTGFGSLISIILSNIVILSAVTLFGFFLFGGISIIIGAGNDNPQQVAKGKQAVTAAVVGFLIVFSAYWIIRVIETLTGISITLVG